VIYLDGKISLTHSGAHKLGDKITK
jgi:hypothetical protein